MKDFPLSQLRIVSLVFRTDEGIDRCEYFVHESDTDGLVNASIKIHHETGSDDKFPGASKRLWEIEIFPLKLETTTYWWSGKSPIHEKNHETSKRVWAHPKLLKLEADLEKAE